MNPRRFATVAAALCGTLVLAGWIVGWLAGFGATGIESKDEASIEERRAPSLAADAEPAQTPRATKMSNTAVASADGAIPDSQQMPLPESPPVRVATASPTDLIPNDVKEPVRSIDIPDDCQLADGCIDRYLWALDQRTPKEDTIKVQELRKVTVDRRAHV